MKLEIQPNNIHELQRERATTAAQDRFLVLTARRQPNITAPALVIDLQRAHNITVGCDTIRNRLHETNIHNRRLLRCPPLSRGNRAARLEWCQKYQNWNEHD